MVIGIVAVLAAIVIVAINPTKQLGEARDGNRRTHLNSVMNAVGQYAIDHGGRMPCDPSGSPCVDGTWRMLGTQTTGCDENTTCGVTGIASACLNLRVLSGTYLSTIPTDPRYGSGNAFVPESKTLYLVLYDGRIGVKSCRTEEAGEPILYSR